MERQSPTSCRSFMVWCGRGADELERVPGWSRDGIAAGAVSLLDHVRAATVFAAVTRERYPRPPCDGGTAMHGKNLEGRITRLKELIMRLWQEELCWRDDIYPLHHMERN